MHTVTAKIPEDLHKRLEALAGKTDRKKSYLIRQALEEFMEELEDEADARRIMATERKEERLSLQHAMSKYGLEH